jgi:hypothetical protein
LKTPYFEYIPEGESSNILAKTISFGKKADRLFLKTGA